MYDNICKDSFSYLLLDSRHTQKYWGWSPPGYPGRCVGWRGAHRPSTCLGLGWSCIHLAACLRRTCQMAQPYGSQLRAQQSTSWDTCFSACGMASPCGLGLSQHGHWFPEGEFLAAQADVIEDTWDYVCLILLGKAGHRASCDGSICKQTLPFKRRSGKEFVLVFDPQSQPQIRIISFLPCENCIHTSESILSSPSKMLRPKVQDFIIQNQVQLQMRFSACLLFPVLRSMCHTAPHSQYWMRRQKQDHCNKTFLSKGVLWLNELCAPQIPMLKH